MRRPRGFTLIEIAMSVFILLLILLLAVPSLKGVLADRRARRSLNDLNNLVRQAQELSVTERRPYLLVWTSKGIVLRPETFAKGEEKAPVTTMPMQRGETFAIKFVAALQKDPPPEWIFWPSGTCEPVTISFQGGSGSWTADYSALTARPTLSTYAAK
jgi:prepilin-type N-terminal cleavage/methylation domain-containing protein